MRKTKPKEIKATRIVPLFKDLHSRIASRKKKQMYLLVAGMLLTAVIETATLGLIAFFISSLSAPGRALGSQYIEYIRGIVPSGILENTETFILFLSIAVLLFIIVKNICLALVKYASVRYAASLQAYFGDLLLQNFLQSEYSWYVQENPSNLVNSVNWRIQAGSFFQSLFQLITDFFLVTVVLIGLFMLQPLVTVAVLIVLGGSAGIIFFSIKNRIDKESKKVSDLNRESFVEASKAVHGIKDVKIFLKERYFSKLFSNRVYRLARLQGKQQVLAASPIWFLESVGFAGLMIAIVVMLFLLQSSTEAVFSIIALIAVAAWRLLPALNRISSSITKMRITVPYIDTVLYYIDAPPKEPMYKVPNKKNNGSVFIGNLDLRNVSFSYSNNGDYALRDVSFSIEKGRTVGIIGHSGAGKSTLVDIIIGLLKPKEGDITIDGRSFNEDVMTNWRDTIGYVPQFPYIYHGTLAQNVAFGEQEESINREQVLNACRMASIDFLDQLHNGIDTVIGERGIRLSGGQQQRVAIARALYREPDVLIFDEATSSLDTKSEKEIQKTIYSFKDTKTLIIIAHRLSTVEDCDKIIWLETGKMVAIGPATEILNKYKQEYQKISEEESSIDGVIPT
jgi:ABC-type multidrug transport system fused ATPase/permease subunit